MNQEIKFSHIYKKMPENFDPSKLIQIMLTTRDHLSHNFEVYDTETVDGEYYKLPSGEVLVMFLLTRDNVLWTTIRRYTPSKFAYYSDHIGQYFDIDVAEEEEQ